MLDARGDQAAGLRRLFQPARVRVLPILGGDACATRIVQLARALRAAGEDVLVLDESSGEAVSAAGADPHGTLGDLVRGRVGFDAVAPQVQGGVRVMLVADGYEALGALGFGTAHLFSTLAAIPQRIGMVLVNARRLMRRVPPMEIAGDVAILVAPNAAGIANAYRQVKRIASAGARAQLVIDGVASEPDGLHTYQRIANTAERFLGVVPRLAGCLPAESSIRARANDSALERLAAEIDRWSLAEYRGSAERNRKQDPQTGRPIRSPAQALH